MNRRNSIRPNAVVQYVQYISTLEAPSNGPESNARMDLNVLLARLKDEREWTAVSVTRIFHGLEDLMQESVVTAVTIRKAIAYFSLVSNALFHRHKGELNSKLGKLFLQHRHAVIHWLHILLSFGSYPTSEPMESLMPLPPFSLFSTILHAVQHISEEMIPERDYRLWFSPSFIELFITRFWRCDLTAGYSLENTRYAQYPVIFMDTSTECACPSLSMVAKILSVRVNESILEELIRSLEANPDLLRFLMEGVQKRAMYLCQRTKDAFQPDTLLSNVIYMVDIVHGLRSLARQSEFLRESLFWGKKLSDIVYSIEGTLAYLLNERDYLDEVTSDIPGIVQHLIVEVLDGDVNVKFSRRAPLACCLLNLLHQTEEGLEGGARTSSAKWLAVCSRWKGFALHTTIAKALAEAFSTSQPNSSEPSRGGMHCIVKAILNAELTAKATGFGVCDNALCPSVDTLRQSRVCNCRQVAYCSDECQKIDWDALHREECAAARLDYNVRHAGGLKYDIRDRAVHLKYLEDDLVGHIASCQECQVPVPPIRTIDMSGLNLQAPHRTQTAGSEWDREGVAFTQEYYKPRFEAHFRGEAVLAEDRRVVELIIPITTRTLVHLTAVLQRSAAVEGLLGSGTLASGRQYYQVVYSIARFGRVLTEQGLSDPLS